METLKPLFSLGWLTSRYLEFLWQFWSKKKKGHHLKNGTGCVQFHLEWWREDGKGGREEEGRKEKAGGKENL